MFRTRSDDFFSGPGLLGGKAFFSKGRFSATIQQHVRFFYNKLRGKQHYA